ncbi:class I SAM-dependent methyltransferase [Thalassospira sp. HF15]|uniref:class I SAM-dependent methyltransferase n=1 Tax=Thalassospira sp. HF15 TaxID=2722755 RepID=UPI00143214C3|nr:class I SAM-dependent methyltransferase [Thalassospira sp. HF15]NIY77681.1 class I SAM-dependent methyltransferase [Thalassospira sp. HF15]
MNIDPKMDPRKFWQETYEKASPQTSGKPSAILERFVKDRTAGCALELGCGKGDDAVWLAKQGWTVTAVDVSETALGYARANAERNGVEHQITFEAHDLTKSLPDGVFDLVSAQFLQSPVEFPREAVLNRAAAMIAKGGLLLVTTHGSRPSWSWAPEDTVFPTPQEALYALTLDHTRWRQIAVDNFERMATGPKGEKGSVIDTVIALERL